MSQPHILIADDDVAIVDSLTLALEDEGYIVNSVTDERILEKVDKHKPDLILLDIWLKNLNGGDVCRALKAHRKTHHIPVIMISANKQTEAIALACGADEYVPKPFELDHLLDKIKQMISKPKAV